MRKLSGWLILAMMIVAIIVVFNRISDAYDIHTSSFEEGTFDHEGNTLAGTLFKPEEREVFPVVVFIHGDGAIDRTSDSEYTMLMNAFIDKGIGCFSYDKGGVGESEGDWLAQSMSDRGAEVVSAMTMLSEREDISEIGLLGISQGGFVLSEIAKITDDYAFMILISGAVDWMEQSRYVDEVTLAGGDLSEAEKDGFREYMDKIYHYILEDDYQAYVDFVADKSPDSIPMGRERFDYIHLNMESNAMEGIHHMQAPFLGLFGGRDRIVDGHDSYGAYLEAFAQMNKTDSEVILYEDGTHSLLKSKYAGNVLTPLVIAEMFIVGDGIYVDGVLDKLGDWVNESLE